MSRGVKDLRELICVSRLTIRDSDEDLVFSDDEDGGRQSSLRRAASSLSGSSDSRQGSGHSQHSLSTDVASPDSGIGTNGMPATPEGEGEGDGTEPHPPRPGSARSGSARRRKKKKQLQQATTLETVPQKHGLPKSVPLPPVQSGPRARRSSSSGESTGSGIAEYIHPAARGLPSKMAAQADIKSGNFDHLLVYMDVTLVSEWLSQSNASVTDLATWCHTGENFVHLAHFWLSDFPDGQKQDILCLEHSILLDHLSLAFSAGVESGKVKQRDLLGFLEAVFREYPSRLLSYQGAYMFLDYLCVLSSERHSSYKKLLSDAKCSTRDKQNAQAILAVRSFALVSVWYAVLNFYRRLQTVPQTNSVPVSITSIGKTCPNLKRMQHAIRNGYLDVVTYMLKAGKVKSTAKDEHERTLVFTAVMYNQPTVLQYFLSQVECGDVNQAADTGNTPLHAAANTGHSHLVVALLSARGIRVNAQNPQCDGATPLHLAVMHGHTEVVKLLLEGGADTSISMGDLDLIQMGTDFGHTEILEILKEHTS